LSAFWNSSITSAQASSPIKPLHAFEIIWGMLSQECYLQGETLLNMIDLPEHSSHGLNPSCAFDSALLVTQECTGRIALKLLQLRGQTDCVFKRLARPLGDMRKHGVCSIADQRYSTTGPVRNWHAVEHGPTSITLYFGDGSSHLRTRPAKIIIQLLWRAPIITILLVPTAPENSDLVEEFSTSDNILYESDIWANPESDVVEIRFFRSLLDRNSPPIGNRFSTNGIAIVVHNPSSVGP
jgi:hypothetical protein